MYNILKLNEIDKSVNNILKDNYHIAKDVKDPDGIIFENEMKRRWKGQLRDTFPAKREMR